MFTAALVTVAKRWKKPKCPSVDEMINKMWHTVTTEYYSVLKRKFGHMRQCEKALRTLRGETSQTQKAIVYNSTYVRLPTQSSSQRLKIGWMVVARDWGGKMGGVSVSWVRSFGWGKREGSRDGGWS